MSKLPTQASQTITLCDDCSSCPEVTINSNRVFITDDFGGKVKLTIKEFNLLKEKIIKGQV